MMKSKTLILILSCMTAGASVSAINPAIINKLGAPAEGLSLEWSDEFEGTALNRDIWNVEVNGSGCGNNELEFYVDNPDNVRVHDGNLVLTARRIPHRDKEFTSGRINTLGKYSPLYGVIEARIKLPVTANGLWPAFWMMGDDIREKGWPYCGETDIMEMGHSDGISLGCTDRLFNGAIHFGAAPEVHQQRVGASEHHVSLQDGEYHSFYCLWTPDVIEMYVDDCDTPYLSVGISQSNDPLQPGNYFHKPNFLLFNLAVGGDFTGIHDPEEISAVNSGPQNMMVDYVRVYSLPSGNLADNITDK